LPVSKILEENFPANENTSLGQSARCSFATKPDDQSASLNDEPYHFGLKGSGAAGTEQRYSYSDAFLAGEEKPPCSVIVCPGGGYSILRIMKAPVANGSTHSASRFLLKYRLGPRYHHPAPLQGCGAGDSHRFARARLSGNSIRTGLAFSGSLPAGMFASTISTHFDAGKPDDSDTIERVSSRRRRSPGLSRDYDG